jgi:hypothetical protein
VAAASPIMPGTITCAQNFQICMSIGQPQGPTCEQRLATCKRTHTWTNRYGAVHQAR